ncbi:restriction system-associated AAA family ATPase [Mangrovibacterium diazotrophicum]|uniref:Restriction system-associated AAA family ATPase n=1 Tax=Mangrovibacterium diazotrophicum TaxID=1261403 RepID=A0A419W4S6_9BACT|nr:restriction system-associated AAA family ATPase [Mangrovibacterium diazotrophicum]RKD90430.1 restriction system-associated AAA family ATPase [Mangrovibacterium diazotrophicum]
MKLKKVSLKNPGANGLLREFEWIANYDLDDVKSLNPKCLIGVNGSGKSQLLEAITEIFYLLEDHWKNKNKLPADLCFNLEFFLNRPEGIHEVRITKEEKKKVEVYESDGAEFFEYSGKLEELLPQRIVGYTSGQNETLSLRYLDVYSGYAEEVGSAALKPESKDKTIETPRFSWVDYDSNIAVLVANFMLRSSTDLLPFESQIRLQSIDSFRVIVQLKSGKEIKLTHELEGYIDNLKRISTTYDYLESRQSYVFDYFVDDQSRRAFNSFFKNASELFLAFYKLGLLNELMIQKKVREGIKKQRKDHKTIVKPPIVPDSDKVFRFDRVKVNRTDIKHEIDYIGLSDGEHQFVHILGTILMFDEDNTLFLLDEPESHFNPIWRIQFLKTIKEITKHRFQDFLITTHAPYLLSDTPREDIYIFKRNGNDVTIEEPSKTTFGASFDELLDIAFEIKPPISQLSTERINNLVESQSEDEIRKGIATIGESAQKIRLFQRLVELKNKN